MASLKQLLIALVILGMSAAAFSCSGNTDDDAAARLTLTPSTRSIKADGSEAVTFRVTDGAADVTANASIRCTTDNTAVKNASFSTSKAGEYVFVASYGGKNSEAVTISATAVMQGNSQFVRHICVMEFTGQWCGICPAGYNNMNFVIGRGFSDVAHVIALHDDTGGADEYALLVQREMSRDFGVEGYPAALVDLRDLSPLFSDTGGTFKKSLIASQEAYPAYCGVAVKSTYDAGAKQATATVRVFSEQSGPYRVALWIVEDDIVAMQNVSGRVEPDYIHHHVARMLVSSVDNDYTGEVLGEIPAGEERSKDFVIPVDAAWNLDNTYVYALAIGADGYVNNMAVCKIAGGDTDYDRTVNE